MSYIKIITDLINKNIARSATAEQNTAEQIANVAMAVAMVADELHELNKKCHEVGYAGKDGMQIRM